MWMRVYPRRGEATWKFLWRVQIGVSCRRRVELKDSHHTPPLSARSRRSLKFQVLKCGPDKSCRQGPHLPIRTQGEVAYPLRTSILFPIPAFLSFSLSHTLFSCSALSHLDLSFPSPFLTANVSRFLLSFLFETCSFLPYVKADLRVSALAAAEVPPLAITMKDGHWARGPDHSWQTHAWATFVVTSGSMEIVDITVASSHLDSQLLLWSPRYKYAAASSETANHNLSLAFALARAFAVTYLFQYFLSCLFRSRCFQRTCHYRASLIV